MSHRSRKYFTDQAEFLGRHVQSTDPATREGAIERVQRALPQTRGRSASEVQASFRHTDALDVIAREQQTPSWRHFQGEESTPALVMFLVRQNIDYLYGRFFYSGVMAAPDEASARRALLEFHGFEDVVEDDDEEEHDEGFEPADMGVEFFDPWRDDDGDRVGIYPERLDFTYLGPVLGSLPTQGVGVNRVLHQTIADNVHLLCATYGEDNEY